MSGTRVGKELSTGDLESDLVERRLRAVALEDVEMAKEVDPPTRLTASTSLVKDAMRDSKPCRSVSHDCCCVDKSVTWSLRPATSVLSLSLSALRARATSWSRTFEWISSASYCRRRSSRVVM